MVQRDEAKRQRRNEARWHCCGVTNRPQPQLLCVVLTPTRLQLPNLVQHGDQDVDLVISLDELQPESLQLLRIDFTPPAPHTSLCVVAKQPNKEEEPSKEEQPNKEEEPNKEEQPDKEEEPNKEEEHSKEEEPKGEHSE